MALVLVAVSCGLVFPAFAQGRAQQVQEPKFFEVLSDVPLMPGLYEIPDESVVFDKPGGRIAESTAAARDLSGEEIRFFYGQALSQMGWTRASGDSFVRQDEVLILRIEQRDGYTVARFSVSPAENLEN